MNTALVMQASYTVVVVRRSGSSDAVIYWLSCTFLRCITKNMCVRVGLRLTVTVKASQELAFTIFEIAGRTWSPAWSIKPVGF